MTPGLFSFHGMTLNQAGSRTRASATKRYNSVLVDFCQPRLLASRRRCVFDLPLPDVLISPRHRHRLATFARRDFSEAGPSVWNSFADYLRDSAAGKDTFKQRLKTFLFA